MSTNVDVRKFNELVVCLVSRAQQVGLTKLEKLLYFCDFHAAEILGEPITGETYRRFELGPVPKHFVPLMSDIEQSGAVTKTIEQLSSGGKWVHLHASRQPDNAVFSDGERRIIEDVLREFGNRTATQLVAETHKELTYKLTKRNEDIPYFLAPYRRYRRMGDAEAVALLKNEDYANALREKLAAVAA